MDKPVALLTFANHPENSLDKLKQESNWINRSLAILEDEGVLQIHREESATIEDILHAINRFEGRIILFHYAGHADQQSLFLEDGKGQALGLAKLLAAEPHLGFVFLNGCSTQPQVDLLLNQGIHVVIGTDGSIQDTQAADFSRYFYSKLANQGTLQQAFDYACHCIDFKGKENYHRDKDIVYRDLKVEAGVQKDFKWALKCHPQMPQAVEWQIPQKEVAEIDDFLLEEVNCYLLEVLEIMAEQNPIIAQKQDQLMDDREYFDLIIKNYPWNIGSQISGLVGLEEQQLTIRRLKQLISTYTACIQWLYFVALSQMWKEQKLGNFNKRDLNTIELFPIGYNHYLSFDYLSQFSLIIRSLKAKKIALFVPQFADIAQKLDKPSDLQNAYLYLESIRNSLFASPTEFSVTRIPNSCIKVEKHLSIFLKELAFLCNYQMVVVRDINVINARHRNVSFRHQLGRLNAHTGKRLFIYKNPWLYDNYLENNAVVLMKDLKKPGESLSLSPFFIDRNAFYSNRNEKTDLYTFAYFNIPTTANPECYYYFRSEKNCLEIENQDFIHTELKHKEGRFQRTQIRKKGRLSRDESLVQPYQLLNEQFEDLRAHLQ